MIFVILFYVILTFILFASEEPEIVLKSQKQTGIIIIDPSHGGMDSGAVSSHIINGERIIALEKDITLDIALSVKEQVLELCPNIQVILTRDKDESVSFEKRIEIANSVNFNDDNKVIFISIHANSSLNAKERGYEIYINNDRMGQNDHLLAETINMEFTNIFNDYLPFRGIKQANYFILRNVQMPVIITEIGFLSNLEDMQLINSGEGLEKYTLALSRGLITYISLHQ
jgi:N-acetylmuramoyl-L-alanine amidase